MGVAVGLCGVAMVCRVGDDGGGGGGGGDVWGMHRLLCGGVAQIARENRGFVSRQPSVDH